MGRDKPWIIFKTVLYPLTMMDIPVNYQNPENRKFCKYQAAQLYFISHNWSKRSPLQTIFLPCVSRCYGHIIEHTESIGSTAHRMMSRRPGRELWMCKKWLFRFRELKWNLSLKCSALLPIQYLFQTISCSWLTRCKVNHLVLAVGSSAVLARMNDKILLIRIVDCWCLTSHTHLTRAMPFLTAPVITLSTSCRAAPAASLAQW